MASSNPSHVYEISDDEIRPGNDNDDLVEVTHTSTPRRRRTLTGIAIGLPAFPVTPRASRQRTRQQGSPTPSRRSRSLHHGFRFPPDQELSTQQAMLMLRMVDIFNDHL